MRQFYAVALLAIVTGSSPAAGQNFVNGDLEANSPCGTQILNSQFNTFMYDAGYAFGTTDRAGYKGEIYLSQTSGQGCVEGPAQKGTFFLGLASYQSGMVDAMSLKLDKPLEANKTYRLTFYTKKSKSVSPAIGSIPLEIGYTTDSVKFGTLIKTIQAPTSTSWTLHSINFRATVPTRYITVRAVKAASGGPFQSYTFVDNFSMAVGTSVAPEQRAFAMAPHPNPFRESFRFSLSATTKMPCVVTLTDMTGRVVVRKEVTDPEVRIGRENLGGGVYLLHVLDGSGAASYSRIIAQ